MERDFKGVWIPKEIWLNDELTLLDKAILIEIDSLDNEDHCTAGNDYLAKFCQCSERKVSEAITKLTSLGFIEVLKFDGRHRTIKSLIRNRTLTSMQSSKNCEAGSQKILSNNIYNNIDKDIISNKLDITEPVEKVKESKSLFPNAILQTPRKSKKQNNLYVKCIDEIMQYTNNIVLREKLKEYLDLRLQIAKDEGKPFYTNMFKGLLNDLDRLTDKTDTAIKIVEQSIKKGWKGFYELKDYNKSTVKSHPSEKNVDTIKKSDEELDLADEVY